MNINSPIIFLLEYFDKSVTAYCSPFFFFFFEDTAHNIIIKSSWPYDCPTTSSMASWMFIHAHRRILRWMVMWSGCLSGYLIRKFIRINTFAPTRMYLSQVPSIPPECLSSSHLLHVRSWFISLVHHFSRLPSTSGQHMYCRSWNQLR